LAQMDINTGQLPTATLASKVDTCRAGRRARRDDSRGGLPYAGRKKDRADYFVGRATVPAGKAAAEGCVTLVGKKTVRIVL